MKLPSNVDIALVAAGLAITAVALILIVVAPDPVQRASPATTVKAAVAALDARHYRDARRILDPLVNAGNADAQTWLGYMDENGLGADPNMSSAVAWFTKASKSGSAQADRQLGQIYLDGRGVLQNVDQARQWLQLGADRGDAVSQRMLGEIFMKGIGVPADPAEAYAWLAIAASQGDQPAAHERDALLPSLPPATFSRAQSLAQQTLASIATPQATKS